MLFLMLPWMYRTLSAIGGAMMAYGLMALFFS